MPPKVKEAVPKKPPPPVIRPPISESSLVHVPDDAVEGYQERLEKGIEWTLIEKAAKHHNELSSRPGIRTRTFAVALQNKINQSILSGFLNQESDITLEQQWELLPITLWDNEKFANEEAKICFENRNNITNDLIKLIKKAVKSGDSEVLKRELKLISILRVNDAQMTEIDESLLEYKNVVSLSLCGNFLSNLNGQLIPTGVKTLELQFNRMSNLEAFVEYLPTELLYLGLARNLLTNEFIEPLARLPYQITVLDLSDNDIYHLVPLLNTLAMLPNLQALLLVGNPCAVCHGYARTTLMRLPLLKWLDSRQIMATDRSEEPFEPHPDDLRAAFFTFTVFRIMSAPQPPKPEKGAVTTFHVELELPLLDATRRKFLLFRNHESLVEMLPPPEDGDWDDVKMPSAILNSKIVLDPEQSSHESDIYKNLTTKNSREILHYTIFETNKVQWNKVINFQEPAVKIFCPDLTALRDTFRTVITLRLIYSVTVTGKQGKPDKKSSHSMKPSSEHRVTLATIKCALRQPDWSQPSQHFHWDDSLGTNDAIHWGDGDLSVLQYSQAPVKVTKGKQDTDVGPSSRQLPPDNLTCHFGFGIETLRA
ncbi:unnamed protein product [Chilo suppressalis]|uniref:Leucine-rich repeat-containing protein 43 n=1 Tax=Chilo suppressalis TaxID=168631 RepID=A0ABN8B767_CHISP|nr:hypothetical protein evm_002148 [Chilo suppressalis]CAH0404662.1 unnamed protein product [Chilo suppressalis]